MPPVPPDPDSARGDPAPRRPRRLTVIARVAVVVIALAVGGYLIRQGEASKHLSAAGPSRAALASPAASPSAPSAVTAPTARVPATSMGVATSTAVAAPTATPARTAVPLPPVSSAPGIVRAMDSRDPAPPPGSTVERFAPGPARFTVAVPAGWQAVRAGPRVTLTGPDGSFVAIDVTRHVKRDMVAEAEYLRVADRGSFPGYQRIFSPPNLPRKKFIQPVAIRRTLGALWEFDWVTSADVQLREDVLLFDAGGQSYTVYSAGPAGRHDNDWNRTTLGIVSRILPTFRPVAS